MPANKILVDSSFLYTLFAEDAHEHEDAVVIADVYQGQFVIPQIILTETAFLFNRSGGVPSVVQFLDRLTATGFHYELVSVGDLQRAREIMATYVSARLDFVDCCIMALSERLNVTQVCTLDRRDFSIFRPKHCDYLEILP
jgi:predicted nucleic acid-binding protein